MIGKVWEGLVVEENNLQVQISALRKPLGAGALATIPARGYRLVALPERQSPLQPGRRHSATATPASNGGPYVSASNAVSATLNRSPSAALRPASKRRSSSAA